MTRYGWNRITWKKIQVNVFKLQKRIYKASARGQVKLVHSLQRLLIRSWYARLLAVRKVTQDNQGKNTAGIDGIKTLNPEQRLHLADLLIKLPKPQALRRVYIPKPGTAEKRPLGIPAMQDRALQALFKLALEPEWEAKFEPNSYGFRPGRSAHDAIAALFIDINRKPKWVLDADIKGCFDHINHEALLRKLNSFPLIQQVIKAWLKSGVMERGVFQPSESGTPQGGVISPLLANIALHGLETLIAKPRCLKVIRFADDFVITSPLRQTVEWAQTRVAEWLEQMGLELKVEKTQIVHTYQGFDFLGFQVRQFIVPRSTYGFKTLIKPSQSAQNRHQQEIRRVIRLHAKASQRVLIAQLNLITRGWTKYYSTVVSKKVFGKMNHLMHWKVWQWATRRHPGTGRLKVFRRYWRYVEGTCEFVSLEGLKLFRHDLCPIVRHVKVRGCKSPFDGDWVYWSTRKGSYANTHRQVGKLLRLQRGRCPHCGLYFISEDLIEIHHLDHNHANHKWENLVAVHKHCHDQIHSPYSNLTTSTSIHDKDHVGEEPCEVETCAVVRTDRIANSVGWSSRQLTPR
jgi:RNA-directed DNA polymerase